MTEGESTAAVLSWVDGRAAHLCLNRPAALNALNLAMVRSLAGDFERWATDPGIDAIVLQGSGEKAFCAGGDIRAIYDSYLAQDQLYLTFFSEEYKLVHAIHRYPKPTIALMTGYVMGGGMGLAQGCQLPCER